MTEPVLASISALTAALRHFEWYPSGGMADRYEVWSADRDANQVREVVVPLDPSRGDFEHLANRARSELVAQYGRAAKEVFDTLEIRAAARLDTTQWKKETPLQAGIIAWQQGEALYAAARAQLVASAKATRETRRYHGNASAYIASAFLENSFMGQTDVGSFVITAYTPADAVFFTSQGAENQVKKPQQTIAVDRVSGRDVLNTFDRALLTTRAVLDQFRKQPRVELFLDAVSDGVSYEFTKALAEVTLGGTATIQVRREEYGSFADSKVSEVRFEAAEAAVLTQAANAFALDPEPQRVSLIGEVTLLSRSSNSEDRVIRLDVDAGADIRKARVPLSAEQYELALRAHHDEVQIAIDGRLEREGNVFWLYDAERVRLGGSRTGKAASQPAHRPTTSMPSLFSEVPGEDGGS